MSKIQDEQVRNSWMVPLVDIRPSRWQPREPVFDADELWELACSIEELGLINKPVVFPIVGKVTTYELVAGERRVRAVAALAWSKSDPDVSAQEAVATLAASGLAEMPERARNSLTAARAAINVRIESVGDLRRLHQVAVMENIERCSLTPIEEARGLHGLAEAYGWSQRELAQHIGKSQSYVAQRLSLLDLPAETQQAVSTRVLSASHARAIARVPAALQAAMTEWSVQAVQRDESPATTRQIENRADQVAAFVDPDRWLPNGERTYWPKERNRLAMIRWMIQQQDLGGAGAAILKLAGENPTVDSNWLKKKPIEIVSDNLAFGLSKVCQAFGYKGLREVWHQFAEATGRMCESCVFEPYTHDDELQPMAAAIRTLRECSVWYGWDLPCERWLHPEMRTCEHCILRPGALDLLGDPLVIPIPKQDWLYTTQQWSFIAGDPPYVDDPAAYVAHMHEAARIVGAQAAQRSQVLGERHTAAIRAFQDWQRTRPAEELAHFWSHTCVRCARFVDGPTRCHFVTNPLVEGDARTRAPEFGVLVTRDGRMLPRCEQFCHRTPGWPELQRMQGVRFAGHQDEVLSWLHRIVTMGLDYSRRGTLWGILHWLDYPRPAAMHTDWDALQAWLRENWGAIGGDEVIAELLSIAASEVAAVNQRSGQVVMTLFNGQTGQDEEFAPVDFRYITGEFEALYTYPADWPRPWEHATEEDV